jgi:hypothetical protein
MLQSISEPDWKLFSRNLRSLALERFCERVLEKLSKISESDQSFHERYLKIYRQIHDDDNDLAEMFNDSRRSNTIIQLRSIRRRFTPPRFVWIDTFR